MERLKIGDVVSLRQDINTNLKASYLLQVYSCNDDCAKYICILPNTGTKHIHYHTYNGLRDNILDLTEINADDVLAGKYLLHKHLPLHQNFYV